MEIANCNQCPNQCPANDLKCGRGRRYFEQLENPDGRKEYGNEQQGGGHGGHNHGEGHGPGSHSHGEGHGHHGRPEDLYGLMRVCGHYLHHNGGEGEELFAALNGAEQESLKGLLKKLVDSWEQ